MAISQSDKTTNTKIKKAKVPQLSHTKAKKGAGSMAKVGREWGSSKSNGMRKGK